MTRIRSTSERVLAHREARRIVEAAIGHPLPPKAQVHHFNEDYLDNSHGNLVACQDYAYHALLHQRQRALAECGHADWRKCWICQQYAPMEQLAYNKHSRVSQHRACWARRQVTRRREATAA